MIIRPTSSGNDVWGFGNNVKKQYVGDCGLGGKPTRNHRPEMNPPRKSMLQSERDDRQGALLE
jgi:hypothetical protein